MKTLLTILLLLAGFTIRAQEIDSLNNEDEPLITNVESEPSFPGGLEAMGKYIKQNLKWKQGATKVQGSVFVQFIIERSGEITEAKVVRELCETCDAEALRLVREMPTWIPGMQQGKPVRARMVLPIRFGK